MKYCISFIVWYYALCVSIFNNNWSNGVDGVVYSYSSTSSLGLSVSQTNMNSPTNTYVSFTSLSNILSGITSKTSDTMNPNTRKNTQTVTQDYKFNILGNSSNPQINSVSVTTAGFGTNANARFNVGVRLMRQNGSGSPVVAGTTKVTEVSRFTSYTNTFTWSNLSIPASALLWGRNDATDRLYIVYYFNITSANNYFNLNYTSMTFTYSINTSISSVSPNYVVGLEGGANVTVTGVGFFNKNIFCKFGQNGLAGYYVNPTTIICPVPLQANYSTYILSVSMDGTSMYTSPSESVQFEYRCNSAVLCNNNGVCNSSNAGACKCLVGWQGPYCNIPDCSTLGDCNLRGDCLPGPQCNCSSYYSGSTCEIPVCTRFNNCSGKGQCVSSGLGNVPSICSCDEGYYGDNCTLFNCNNRQNCNSGRGGGNCTAPDTCKCNYGFNGTSCDAICTPPCKNLNTTQMVCQVPYTNQCACVAGWTGQYCNLTFDCENVNNCGGNGVCVSSNNCTCNSGWTGKNCSTPVCTNNCSNHGSCIGAFTCACQDGWFGQSCEKANCSAIGNCNNNECIAPNVCNCSSSWSGLNCTEPVCLSCTENQYCYAPNLCICKSGYIQPNCTLPPSFCSYDCNNKGTCTNSVCTCNSGWLPPYCVNPDCSGNVTNNCNGANGFCQSPGVCKCFTPWDGVDCSVDLSNVATTYAVSTASTTSGSTTDEESNTSGQALTTGYITANPDLIKTSPSSKMSDTTMYIIIGCAVGGFILLIVIILIIVLFVRSNGKKKGNKVFKNPNYNQIVYAKSLELGYSLVTPIDNYQTLENLLNREDLALPVALAETCPPTEKDALAKSIGFYYNSASTSNNNIMVKLLLRLINIEISNCTAVNTLFRSNSMAIAVFQTYSKIYGIHYLWDTLGQFVLDLNEISKQKQDNGDNASVSDFNSAPKRGNQQSGLFGSDFEMEVDPNKLDKNGDEEGFSNATMNKYTLLLTTQRLYQNIIESYKNVPDELKILLSHVRECVLKFFPDNIYTAVGSFFFLRFVVPSITAPHVYGLLKEPPNQIAQRNLVLLAKVLQNLANEVQFGSKESHMVKLNDFILENRDSFHTFIDRIAKQGVPLDQSRISIEVEGFSSSPKVPPNVKTNSLCHIHNHLETNKNKIIEYLNNQEPPQTELVKELTNFLNSNSPNPKKT